jgi:hypothetical protein
MKHKTLKTRLALTGLLAVVAVSFVLILLIANAVSAAALRHLDFPTAYLEDDDYLYKCVLTQRADRAVACLSQDKVTKEYVNYICMAIHPNEGWIKDCVLPSPAHLLPWIK